MLLKLYYKNEHYVILFIIYSHIEIELTRLDV